MSLVMEVLRRFEGSRVRIVALSINDATECSIVRMIVSYPDIGREILERAGLSIMETELVGVVLDDVVALQLERLLDEHLVDDAQARDDLHPFVL